MSSFPPILGRAPRVLVLGSMPGAASLRAGQYYAHPHNAFWRIMGELVGAGPELPYTRRCARLRRRGIAVWDVLRSCVRPGSLDARIEPDSMVVNDFAALFAAHPRLQLVACNGGTAWRCYQRLVRPGLGDAAAPAVVQLPSTSPAHASLRFGDKLQRWRDALLPHLCPA